MIALAAHFPVRYNEKVVTPITPHQSGQYLPRFLRHVPLGQFMIVLMNAVTPEITVSKIVGEPEGPFWVHLWRSRNWNLATERQPGAMSFGTCDAAELCESSDDHELEGTGERN